MGLFSLIAFTIALAAVSTQGIVVDVDVNLETSAFSTILVSNFGVLKDGALEFDITLSSSSLRSYLVLHSAENLSEYEIEREYVATYGGEIVYDSLICSYPASIRVELSEQFAEHVSGKTFREIVSDEIHLKSRIPIAKDALYTLMLIHCEPQEGRVRGQVKLYNSNIWTDEPGHLSAGSSGLLVPYGIFVALYFLLLVLWIALCSMSHFPGKSMQSWTPLHILFAVVLLAQCAYLGTSFYQIYQFSISGILPSYVYLIVGISGCIRDTFLLLHLQLAALGWKINRQHLTTKEVRLFSVLFLIYAVLNLLRSFCVAYQVSDQDPFCILYFVSEYVAKPFFMISCIVAINMNVTSLKLSLAAHSWTPSTADTYASLFFFNSFRWILLAYALLPTVLLVINISLLSWKFAWVNDILREFVVICISTGMVFITNPYRNSHQEFFRIAESIHRNIPLCAVSYEMVKASATSVVPSRQSRHSWRQRVAHRIRSRRQIIGLQQPDESRVGDPGSTGFMAHLSRLTQRPHGPLYNAPTPTGLALEASSSGAIDQGTSAPGQGGIEMVNI